MCTWYISGKICQLGEYMLPGTPNSPLPELEKSTDLQEKLGSGKATDQQVRMKNLRIL